MLRYLTNSIAFSNTTLCTQCLRCEFTQTRTATQNVRNIVRNKRSACFPVGFNPSSLALLPLQHAIFRKSEECRHLEGSEFANHQVWNQPCFLINVKRVSSEQSDVVRKGTSYKLSSIQTISRLNKCDRGRFSV